MLLRQNCDKDFILAEMKLVININFIFQFTYNNVSRYTYDDLRIIDQKKRKKKMNKIIIGKNKYSVSLCSHNLTF